MIVLDSDILTLMLWKGAIRSRLDERLAEVAEDQLVTTIVNFEEQIGGWLRALTRKKKISEIIEVYRRLNQQVNLFRKIKLLDFDEVAAARFQALRKQYRRIKANDLKVAAIVMANNAKLVTRNMSDFRQILGPRAEDWTKE